MARLRGLDLSASELTTLTTIESSAGRSPKAGLSAARVASARDFRLAVSNTRLRSISSGPGRLTQAMAITRQAHNGMALTSARSELFLADDGWRPERIAVTPRINVTKAADQLFALPDRRQSVRLRETNRITPARRSPPGAARLIK